MSHTTALNSLRHLWPRALLCGLWALAMLFLPMAGSAEPRQQISAASPAVLLSVGRLLVPGRRMEAGHQRHYRESCSATLLAPEDGEPASLILTAWHCLEYHTDLTDEITFVIQASTGERLQRRVRAVSTGGGMSADWSLMRLQEPLPTDTVSTARIARGAALAPGSRVIMAGFSRDRGLGEAGQVLTFHRDCRVVARSNDDVATDCLAYRGASGGAVFSVDSGRLVGVISRGDSRENSIFVPVSRILGRERGLSGRR